MTKTESSMPSTPLDSNMTPVFNLAFNVIDVNLLHTRLEGLHTELYGHG